MPVYVTKRMKSWVEGLGCHLCVASPSGVPMVTVARYAKFVKDDTVAFALTQDEYSVIAEDLESNSWVAFAVSHVGSIRAAYQFKGVASVEAWGPGRDSPMCDATEALGRKPAVVVTVELKEIYCTKPGHVAGQRLDVMAPDELCSLERELQWKDMCPRAAQAAN